MVVISFRNTGQTCVCANRILVQQGLAQAFVDKLASAVSRLVPGRGTDEEVTQGPLIDSRAAHRGRFEQRRAADRGRPAPSARRNLLRTDDPDGLPLRYVGGTRGTFEPIASVFLFEREEDAVELANATEFGLAGYFYSRDIGRIWRVAEALECGMVGVNTGLISNEVAPFGGIKQSGFGREGSRHSIEDYTELKYVCMGGL